MRILGNKTAALGLPRVFVVALSVIVGGECLMIAAWSLRGSSGKPSSDVLATVNEVSTERARLGCGPIALKMLFAYYNVDCTLTEITRRIKSTPRGTSMLSLKEMAEAKGLGAQGWNLSYDDLKALKIPVIAYLNGNHFVVVDSISTGEVVHVRDGSGQFVMTKSDFVGSWHGETLVVTK
jgi:ABC-type bacteriocin/lantibiotic exporter with double-glycine peptidase domain